MDNVWILGSDELPAPHKEFDLAVWAVTEQPAEAKARSWAGWSDTPLVLGDIDAGRILAFTAAPQPWRGADVAVGSGKIWRWGQRYIAWLPVGDVLVPEIPRALSLAGVELIIVSDPHTYPTPYMDPLWRVVQSEQIFGLSLAALPRFYMPCELDPDQVGVGDVHPLSCGHSVQIDFSRLAEVQRIMPLKAGFRPDLYCQLSWWRS